MESKVSSSVTRSPAARKGRFARITSGMGQRRVAPRISRSGGEREQPADEGDEREIDERDGDVDLEGAESLSLDSARLIGQLRDRDDGSERGILDELRGEARDRRRDVPQSLRIDDEAQRLEAGEPGRERSPHLSLRNADYACADGLGHIGARIDRKAERRAGESRQAQEG